MQVVIAPTRFWLPSSTSAGPNRICFSEPVTPTLMRVPRGKIGVRRGHAPMIAGAGRFLCFRERASDHDRVRSAGQRLANIAAFAHAAVGDDRDIARGFFEVSVAGRRAIDCRRNLRHAEAEHAARSARRAGTYADEHRGRSAFHDLKA